MTKPELPDTPIMHALVLAGHVIERSNTIPILGNVRLHAFGGRLYLFATDLDMVIAVDVDDSDAEFDTTSGHEALRGVAATAGRIGFEATSDHKLSVTTLAGARYRLATLPADDFPTFKDFEVKASFRLPAAQLHADLKAVRAGISTEETRYYLNGIYCHISPAVESPHSNLLTFATTDGHRLFRIRRPGPVGATGMPGVIIPRKAIKVLSAALERQGDEDVQIEVSAEKARFTLCGVTITTKTIDGTFPDYQRVIPGAYEQPRSPHGMVCAGTLTVDAPALIAATRAGAAIMTERTRAVQLCIDKGEVMVRSTSPENGVMHMRLDGEVSGDLPAAIGLNAASLIDCCMPFGDAKIRLGMSDATSPVLIVSAGDDQSLTVVQMPMRV